MFSFVSRQSCSTFTGYSTWSWLVILSDHNHVAALSPGMDFVFVTRQKLVILADFLSWSPLAILPNHGYFTGFVPGVVFFL